MKFFHPLASSSLLLGLANVTVAQLPLNAAYTLDLDNLVPSATAIGGVALDPSTERLWLSEATGTNVIYEIDALSGALVSTFSASVVPGLTNGPDAMTLDPFTGDLVMFSAANESAAGVVTQDGTLVRAFPSSHGANASCFDALGALWIYSDQVGGGDDALHRLDPITGALGPAIPIVGQTTRAWSMDIDPVTGNLFVAVETNLLIEVELPSGVILSTTDLSPFVNTFTGDFAFGLTFDATGERLFFSHSTHASGELVVLNRTLMPVGSTYCSPAVANSTGAPGVITAAGSNVVLDNALTLRAEGLPPGRFGFFLTAQGAIMIPGPPGQGTLCLAPPVGLFQSEVRNSGIAGTINLTVDLSALPTNPPHAVVAGETWRFQAWYRDENPAPTSNFTDATAVLFQ